MASTHLPASAMEQTCSPDVLADGSHQLDLQTIPNCEGEAILATGSVLNRQEVLPDECEEFEVPEAPPELSCRKQRKVHGGRVNICELPYLRTFALLDIPTIAMKFGEDLLSVSTSWLDEANARRLMEACGVATRVVLHFCLKSLQVVLI